MKTQFIDIPTADGNCDVFIAYPNDQHPYPAVLLLMDGFGPRTYLYEMAKTLAKGGYYVLLPNLFYRTLRAPVVKAEFPLRSEDMPEVFKKITPLFQSLTSELVMRDAETFIKFLIQQKQVLPGKVGITGYCMGGRLAIQMASTYPDRVAAVASFHAGNLATGDADSPHLHIKKIQAELYIAHADNDQHMPAAQIERLRIALDQASVRYSEEIYQGATHGFTMADLPAYNEVALKRHWKNLFDLLERCLKRRSSDREE